MIKDIVLTQLQRKRLSASLNRLYDDRVKVEISHCQDEADCKKVLFTYTNEQGQFRSNVVYFTANEDMSDFKEITH